MEADLFLPNRTGDLPQPNTRRNLSRNLNESCINMTYTYTANEGQIPGRHRVVKDGIDGRVDVEHEAAKVENVEVHFDIDMIEYFIG